MPPVPPQAAPIADARHWYRVDLVASDEVAQIIGAECFELGSCGLQSEAAGPGSTRLAIFFDQAHEPDVIRQGVANVLDQGGHPRIELRISREEAADWNAEWRRYYRPVWATEKIVVHPPWIPVEVEPGQLAIVIDPAMAFGTGGHESTQAALAGLEGTKLAGCTVLDVGIGSGVLAIAACQLGVARLVGVDIDPIAIDNARLNIELNLGQDAAAQIDLRHGSAADAGPGPFDVIVANIESHILLPMVPDLLVRLAAGGGIIFSGLLRREESDFVAGIVKAGLTIDGRWQRDDWFSCRARRVE